MGIRAKTPTLKLAEPPDLALLLEFAEEYYLYDHLAFDKQKAMAAMQGLINDHSLGRLWLIQDGTATVGYIVLVFGYSLEFHGRDGFIDEFYIRAAHRGRGLGSEAMALAEEEARALGVQALHLEVERENEKSQALYRRRGYVDHDRYLMTKRLVEDAK